MTVVAIIGLGEVGTTLADDLASRARIVAWDIQFADAASKPAAAARSRAMNIARDAGGAVGAADIVISAVTAAQTEIAASDSAPALKAGALFLDLNSASPQSKLRAAECINGVGAHYVEAAVMAPIAPKRIATPMLLGGPHAEAATPSLRDLGFAGAAYFSPRYGQAAAAKLCRSIIVKGLEALLTEALVSARHYGVEDAVLGSLSNLLPAPDWPELTRYMVSRAIEHGARRAEEMREAGRMVDDVGLAPLLSNAIANRQRWASDFPGALNCDDLGAMLDHMRRSSRESQQ